MPYYDFRCLACRDTFELHLPIHRRDDAACPRCGSRRVERLPSPFFTIVASSPSARGDTKPCCGGTEACACSCEV